MPDLHYDQKFIPENDVAEEEPFTVNEIIGNTPGWILHSGMNALFVVVSIGIGLTLIIRYPDKISAPGVISTTDPYKPVTARAIGVIDTVFLLHNAKVAEGDPILYIQNAALRTDVEQIYDEIDSLDRMLGRRGDDFIFSAGNFSLGPMQGTFASIDQQVREYVHFLNREDYRLKQIAMDREIEALQNLNSILMQEKELTGEEVLLSRKDLSRNEFLFENGIISERDMEMSQATHLGIQKSYLVKDNSLTQNRIRIASLNQSKADLFAAREEQLVLYQTRIHENILNFMNIYNTWYQKYYVCAPDAGTLQMASDILPGQTLHAGEVLGYVVPDISTPEEQIEQNSKYGKIWVSPRGIGKIQEGHRAIIHVEAYPYKEFGTLEGAVERIFPVAEEHADGSRIYEVHLSLDQDLRTDYGHQVRYSPDMSISVSVIAEDRSLFQRIFEQFFNLINQHVS